jgi:hypothetical protein
MDVIKAGDLRDPVARAFWDLVLEGIRDGILNLPTIGTIIKFFRDFPQKLVETLDNLLKFMTGKPTGITKQPTCGELRWFYGEKFETAKGNFREASDLFKQIEETDTYQTGLRKAKWDRKVKNKEITKEESALQYVEEKGTDEEKQMVADYRSKCAKTGGNLEGNTGTGPSGGEQWDPEWVETWTWDPEEGYPQTDVMNPPESSLTP